MDYINENIYHKYIKKLKDDIDDKFSLYVPQSRFTERLKDFTLINTFQQLEKTVDFLNDKSELSSRSITTNEEHIRDMQSLLAVLKRDMSLKQNWDEFKDFKQVVYKKYATKDNIKDVTTKLKDFSSVEDSEVLKNKIDEMKFLLQTDYCK